MLSAGDATALLELGTATAFPAGAAVLREGGMSGEVVLVVSGWLKVERGDGRATVLNLCRAGDVLGEVGFLDGEPHSATLVALTNTEARVIPADAFRAHIEAQDRKSVV